MSCSRRFGQLTAAVGHPGHPSPLAGGPGTHARRGVLLADYPDNLYLAALALSAASTIWPLVNGPQVFVFNHLAGYVPGPIYDEVLSVPTSLLWFRLATLCLAGGIGCLLGDRKRLGTALLLLFGGVEASGTRLGFRMTDQALAEALGGFVETEELVLHYPRALPESEVSQFLGDLRFRHHQLVGFLGASPPEKLQVFLYRSEEEKQRLVGAASTQFAKPWRREIHVNRSGFPHPVIKHELVHAMAASWGSSPFGVPASFGGLVWHMGVIEGLAVGADNPLVDGLSLHQWTAAMKKKGLLPDVADLMTVQGFLRAPPSRAYTTAGSFLRFLSETYGKERLRNLYRDGDFERAVGHPLPVLARQFEAFLSGVTLEPQSVEQAFARFRKGSLFDRPCAREVSHLTSAVAKLMAIEPHKALQLAVRCRALQPEEPSLALLEAEALERLGQSDASGALLDQELARLEAQPTAWAEAAWERALLAQRGGDLVTAKRLWSRIASARASPAMERKARLLLDGSGDEAVRRYFGRWQLDPGAELFLLGEARGTSSSYALRYLLARRLQQEGESAAALPMLERLLQEELPPVVAKETTRLAIEAAFALGRCRFVDSLATSNRFGSAFTATALEWVERCDFAYSSRKSE